MWVCLCCRQFLAFDAITWEQLVLKPSTSVEAPGNSATLLLTFALAIHQQVPVRPGNTAQCLARDLIPLKQVKKNRHIPIFPPVCRVQKGEDQNISEELHTVSLENNYVFCASHETPLPSATGGERDRISRSKGPSHQIQRTSAEPCSLSSSQRDRTLAVACAGLSLGRSICLHYRGYRKELRELIQGLFFFFAVETQEYQCSLSTF